MARPDEVPWLRGDTARGDLGYTVSAVGEPHAERRVEIYAKYPEIRELFGYDSTQVWITVGVHGLQLGIAAALSLSGASWWWVLGVAYVVGSIAHHWCGVVIHEASHNTVVAGGELPNRWVAMFANLVVIVPSAMAFRRYHNDHHLYLGVESLDNDLPTHLEIRWIANNPVLKAGWFFLFPLIAIVGRGFVARAPNRWELTNIAVQGLFTALLAATLGWTAVVYLLLSTLFAFGLHPIAAHWVHEHYLFEENQESYSYYGPLNLLTFNMGYHVEHHDFPGIPGSRLPELHSLANEYYASLAAHDSWFGILWRFVTEDMGHHSRVVRSYDTFLAAREQPRGGSALHRACRADPASPPIDAGHTLQGRELRQESALAVSGT